MRPIEERYKKNPQEFWKMFWPQAFKIKKYSQRRNVENLVFKVINKVTVFSNDKLIKQFTEDVKGRVFPDYRNYFIDFNNVNLFRHNALNVKLEAERQSCFKDIIIRLFGRKIIYNNDKAFKFVADKLLKNENGNKICFWQHFLFGLFFSSHI